MSARRMSAGVLLALSLCMAALPAARAQDAGLAPRQTVIADKPLQVTLTEPVDGQQYVVGSTIPMWADAFDEDDDIQQVAIYVDGVMIGATSGNSYIGNWVVTAGSHSVRARATNYHVPMKTAYSPTITITGIPNTPPAVSLTSPSNNAVYAIGATVPMTATASDSDGTISRVEFWVDGAKAGQATSSPYAYNWTATAGTHSVVAKAIDNANGTTSSSAVSIRGNVPPTVSVTAPANGVRLNGNAFVTLSANAGDSDGTIGRVEFWVDGAKVGQVTSSPYNLLTWAVPTTTGNHTIQAKAVDNNNATTTSATITVVVNNPPSTTLTAPASQAVYGVGDPVPLAATASDTDGTIARIEFFVDGAKVAEDTSSPFGGTWTATTGNHVVEARATDNDGGIQMSVPASIHVTTPPTVTLGTPGNNASYTTGASVAMTATAADSDGTINRVEFLVDGNKVGQDTSNPYAYSWTATNGDHTVQARAVDNLGAMQTTTAITIHVDTPPSVSLTAPTNGASYYTGNTVSMAATASDSDGTINRVEFWVDGAKVGQDTSSPYAYSWTATPGSHTVQAKAIDNQNATTASTSVSITVGNPVITVNLTAPANGASYTVGDAVAMTATASESGGTINHVEFLVDGTMVGQDASSPYAYSWTSTAGTHTVQARAVDNLGGTGTTSSISITVTGPNQAPTVNLTAPIDNAGYELGAAVAMTATAADSDGTINRVEFWVDGANVGQDTSSPYAFTWTATQGSHAVQARAVDNQGAATSTTAITIRVALTRSYSYNAYQELCKVVEPEIGSTPGQSGATLMGYDGAGNLAWSASGLPASTACSIDGNTTAINARKAVRTYDARNRISTLAFPDANGNQSWSYTPDGLPASVTTSNDAGASSVINAYAYNHRRLLTGETQQSDGNTWSVGYGYDPDAHLAAVTYPDNLTVNYAPNALGQPTQAGAYASNVTYYPNGAMAGFTYGNGIVHTLMQNMRGLPTVSQDADGATAILRDEYTYDQAGNVLYITDAATGQSQRGNRTMTYDDLNRLESATSPMFGTATYTYDAVDNLRHVTVTAGSQARNQDYVYDEHNRLTNVMAGGASVYGLGYDAQGNLANKSGVLYTFDYGNRMRVGGSEAYRYDVQGRRTRSIDSTGHAIDSLYSQSGQLLFQRDQRAAQPRTRQYVYLGGSLLAEYDRRLSDSAITVTYQHTDALGSPVAVTDSSKAVVQRSEYDPYGLLLNRAMEDGPGYTGHVTDAATGLVYMQQRYYDPLIGQHFLSVDPVTAYSPGGAFNQYWYANANPYRMVDPDGRSPNPVYLASGGDWGSWDSVSAGKKPKSSETDESNSDAADESSSNDAGESSSHLPPALPQGLVNSVAGFGDALSFGATKWYREWRGIGSVNYTSGTYTAGKVAGVAYGFALGAVGGLSGGARSVFWSGEGNMERAAAMGRSLERTPIGALMNRFGSHLPYGAWKAASCIYACNASGTAIKIGLQEGAIWRTIERPILQWRGIPFTVVP